MPAARGARGSETSRATEESGTATPAPREPPEVEPLPTTRPVPREPGRTPGGRIRLLVLALLATAAAGLCVRKLHTRRPER